MSKYGYEELQMLYEDGFRGQSSDLGTNNSNYQYTPRSDERLSARFPGLAGIKGQPIGVPTGDFYNGEDEEVAVPKGKLKKKIGELIQDAQDRGMGHAIEHLHDLLKFADSYKK